MAVLNFSLNLPEVLREELISACAACRCHPTQFAAEALESVLAGRRLPRVPAAASGPRIGSRERREEPEPVEARSALAPGEIATTEELSSLEDLNI